MIEWRKITFSTSRFGMWASKNVNVTYLALTDGIVTATGAVLSSILKGITDSDNPPTTVRVIQTRGG